MPRFRGVVIHLSLSGGWGFSFLVEILGISCVLCRIDYVSKLLVLECHAVQHANQASLSTYLIDSDFPAD